MLYYQKGDRKIQTVGTPWQGTPAMGATVNIADKLGFGCGDNSAFGVGVASRWLKKIPHTMQSQVYYYTTEGVRNMLLSLPKPLHVIFSMQINNPHQLHTIA